MLHSVKKILLLLIITLLAAVFAASCAAYNEQNIPPPDSPDASGAPDISDTPDTSVPAAESGTQAIYIYMCGSNLETKMGAATKNIAEMLAADIPENTSVVIETGGSKKWRDFDISPDHLSRYIIENGELVLVETAENANMGSTETLLDFLNYCVTEYPAERTGVILWDHGGGPIKGVCNDERFGMDSLSLNELDEVFEKLDARFSFIGFDACLMATLDTAAVLSDYADYMIASEELEPSGGWDYAGLLSSFGANVKTEEFGKAVCDSYIEKCALHEKEKMATLSLFDLSKIGAFKKAFEDFAGGIGATAEMPFGNFDIITAVDKSTKFGGNSASEGYSNLVDLYNFARELEDYNEFADRLCAAINEMVVYKVNGASKAGACGVSFYYPLIYDENELYTYLAICSSDGYKSYLNDVFTDIPETTIEFIDTGSEAEDGSFYISLTPESKKYLNTIEFCSIEFGGDWEEADAADMEFKALGLDNDMYKDWDTMEFHSNFRGIWVGIDGKLLSYDVVESNEKHIIFSAPVLVNGDPTNLRFSFTFDDDYFNGGYYSFIGVWSGIDENGVVDKEIAQLKPGDEVTVLPVQVDINNASIERIEGDTVTVGEDGVTISEIPLSKQYYWYIFCVTDIFGNLFMSSSAIFEMQYSYDELLNNPLPDGEYAAKIVAISE